MHGPRPLGRAAINMVMATKVLCGHTACSGVRRCWSVCNKQQADICMYIGQTNVQHSDTVLYTTASGTLFSRNSFSRFSKHFLLTFVAILTLYINITIFSLQVFDEPVWQFTYFMVWLLGKCLIEYILHG